MECFLKRPQNYIYPDPHKEVRFIFFSGRHFASLIGQFLVSRLVCLCPYRPGIPANVKMPRRHFLETSLWLPCGICMASWWSGRFSVAFLSVACSIGISTYCLRRCLCVFCKVSKNILEAVSNAEASWIVCKHRQTYCKQREYTDDVHRTT